MKFAHLTLLLVTLQGLALTARGAVSVTATGAGPLPFATIPATPADFSTTTVGTSATAYEDPASLDAAVLTTVAANVNRALTNNTATNPIGTSAYARYNSNLGALQMRPTGNSYSLMMATLVNNAGDNISAFTLTYDYILWNAALNPAAELIPGLRTYFSVGGAAGSWQLLPSLSGLSATTVGASANITGISWPAGGNAYVLWADDNSSPNDDWGNAVDNFAVTGVITTPLPTTIAISAPTNGAVTVPCANVTVTTAVTGNITNVGFFLNGVLFTNDTTLPFGGSVQVPCDLLPGTYSLTAVATDITGATVAAGPVTITVNPNLPPVIAITNTYSGTVTGLTFLVGSPIIVQASYSDDDGITNIQWQVDGAINLTNRINNTWTYMNALAGTHTLRGIATDRLGQQTISANWTITVTNPPSPAYGLLITNGSEWRYLASAAGAQAEEIIPGLFVQWYDFSYSEIGWSSGFGELGNGDIVDGRAERTLIDIGPATKYSAIYFRKKFTVANPNAFPNLVLHLLRDDGAVVWLNGVSVWTNNMVTTTPDAVHPSTLANTNRAAASDDGVNYQVLNLLNLPGSPILSAGDNIIAVQVHNQTLASTDLSFDLMLWGQADLAPTVNLTVPTNGQSIAQCSTTTLGATASAYVTNVSFYANGVLLSSDAAAPFAGSYTNAGLASVQITAVGMDVFGVMATSAPVTLNINPNAVPTLAVTNTFSVTTGTVFLVGSSITNRYLATDDQAVAAVEFYLNGTLRYRDTAGFGSFVLNDAPAGNHTLTLVAFDNCGGSNSTSVALTVTNPPYVLLLTNQALWKYNDDGLTQDVSWVTLAFDDSGWSNGFAELGFGAVAEDNPPVTTIRRNSGLIATNSLVYYFRKVINVSSPAAYSSLILGVLRDDGARIYINGTEVFTTSGLGVTNFPPTVAAGDDGTRYYSTNVSPSLLVAGPNIIAAEVRQNAVTSSDVAFDLMLWGIEGGGPALVIASDGVTHTVTWNDPSGQFQLQRTTTIGNPASWADVPGAPTSPYTQPAGAVPQFYRLRKP